MFTSAIDKINATIGKTVSWLSLVLVLVIVLDVFLRYVFNFSSVANAELEWHLFGAIILLTTGYAFQEDRHVRVDVFYNRFSKRNQAIVNLIGTILLLLPFAFVGFYKSLPFVYNSFAVGETSPDPGGLPARYIIKSTIPVGFGLLFLQGVSVCLKCIQTIRKG